MGQIDPDFPEALPAASTDTYEEAAQLRVLLCSKGYAPRQWLFNHWEGGLEALYKAGEKIEEHYQRMKERKEFNS